MGATVVDGRLLRELWKEEMNGGEEKHFSWHYYSSWEEEEEEKEEVEEETYLVVVDSLFLQKKATVTRDIYRTKCLDRWWPLCVTRQLLLSRVESNSKSPPNKTLSKRRQYPQPQPHTQTHTLGNPSIHRRIDLKHNPSRNNCNSNNNRFSEKNPWYYNYIYLQLATLGSHPKKIQWQIQITGRNNRKCEISLHQISSTDDSYYCPGVSFQFHGIIFHLLIQLSWIEFLLMVNYSDARRALKYFVEEFLRDWFLFCVLNSKDTEVNWTCAAHQLDSTFGDLNPSDSERNGRSFRMIWPRNWYLETGSP